MIAKVVYNRCFGGFSLSRKAVLLAREMSGDPTWGGACIKGDVYNNGQKVSGDYGHIDDVPRHDPILVAVVEQLGPEACGACASLAIEEIASGTAYRIDEYDGNESVQTHETYNWVIAP